jgi:hypothetical protein
VNPLRRSWSVVLQAAAGDAAGAVDAYERELAPDPAARPVRERLANLRRRIWKDGK